jgi:hypothetical protein
LSREFNRLPLALPEPIRRPPPLEGEAVLPWFTPVDSARRSSPWPPKRSRSITHGRTNRGLGPGLWQQMAHQGLGPAGIKKSVQAML